jgi:hypothetical protein
METVHPFLFYLPWVAGLLALAPAVFSFAAQNRWGRATGVLFAGILGALLAFLGAFLLIRLFVFWDASLHLGMTRRVNPATLLVLQAVAGALGAWCGSRLAAREDPGY